MKAVQDSAQLRFLVRGLLVNLNQQHVFHMSTFYYQGYLVATRFKLWSSLLTAVPSPPCPSPWGEGGHRPGEASTALGDPTLGRRGCSLLLGRTASARIDATEAPATRRVR